MFAKVLLTVAVVALIWFGFKYLQRVAELRARPPVRQRGGAQATPPAPQGHDGVQDLEKCPRCSTYRAPGQGSCGRADCPY